MIGSSQSHDVSRQGNFLSRALRSSWSSKRLAIVTAKWNSFNEDFPASYFSHTMLDMSSFPPSGFQNRLCILPRTIFLVKVRRRCGRRGWRGQQSPNTVSLSIEHCLFQSCLCEWVKTSTVTASLVICDIVKFLFRFELALRAHFATYQPVRKTVLSDNKPLSQKRAVFWKQFPYCCLLHFFDLCFITHFCELTCRCTCIVLGHRRPCSKLSRECVTGSVIGKSVHMCTCWYEQRFNTCWRF